MLQLLSKYSIKCIFILPSPHLLICISVCHRRPRSFSRCLESSHLRRRQNRSRFARGLASGLGQRHQVPRPPVARQRGHLLPPHSPVHRRPQDQHDQASPHSQEPLLSRSYSRVGDPQLALHPRKIERNEGRSRPAGFVRAASVQVEEKHFFHVRKV